MMKKQKKSFYIVVGIIIVLIVGILLIKAANKKKEAEDAQADTGTQISVTSFDAGTVTSFSYVYDGETVSLVKDGENWLYEGNENLDLDESIIDTMLSSVSGLSASTEIEECDDLSDYGLDAPSNTITLNLEEETITLYVGDENQILGGTYVMLEGQDTVYLVSASITSLFDYSVGDMMIVEEPESETE